MFDIKWIRDNAHAFDDGLKRRGLEPMAEDLLRLDEVRRAHVQELQDAQTKRNAASKEIGRAVAEGRADDAERLKQDVAALKDFVQEGENRQRELTAQLNDMLAGLPNLPSPETPTGTDESANKEVRRWGEPREFGFAPKQHFELGEALGLMDFELAARLAGARFVVLQGALARLERALAQFMLDLQTSEHGYTEVYPPYLVRDEVLQGTGQLPKFADDLFRTEDGRWLIPTAEVPLTNLVRDTTLDEGDLPLRFTAYTPCFRAEAGAAGRDTRGMIRQHQFSKVELVSIAHPEQSRAELDRMTGCAEDVLKRLELPYRVMALSSGDMGFAAQLTFDLEVWLPGQQCYREISSCSLCGDFQARRMNARFRAENGKGSRHVHTLNGSGLAVGRTLIAVLETYQEADGRIAIPPVLQPYMGGIEVIEAHE